MNKIYRIIWNVSLCQWVVTSELGRGKTKTKTNKKTVALALASFLTASTQPALAWSGAATCDVSNICTLNNSIWDYSLVNHGAGALTIDDGGTYTVNGPTSIKTSGMAGPSYTNINIKDAYANGWAVGIGAAAGIDPATLNGYLNFKASEREVITVTNAAGIVTSVSVYPGSALFSTNQATDVVSAIPNVGPITFFYDAGMVKVSDGIANVSVAASTINPISRNTTLALADGTGSGLAKIIWRSNNTFHPTNMSSNFPDSSIPVTGTKGVNYTTFVGTFTAYDGSIKTVTDADSFKLYLDWLAEEVKASRITSQSVYNTEQSKAYKTSAYNYSYSISSSGAGIAPELGTGRLGDALLKGQGANATVEVADGVVLTHSNGSSMAGVMDLGVNSVAPGSQSEYGMIVVTDSAQGVNNGTIRSVNSGNLTTVLVNKNAIFTNNNLIEIGSVGDYNNMSRYAIAVWKKGLFQNTGTINTYSYKSSINNFGTIIYVRGAARFENSGTINFAGYEKNISGSNYDAFRGIVLNESDSTFLNDSHGVINLGINPTDGSSVGVGVSSGLVLFSSGSKNYIASENKGTINIGQKVQGTNVLWGNAAGGSLNFTNSGIVNLDGNRDSAGKEIDSIIANIGMFRNGNPGGYVADMFHTGIINVQGYGNIALKALTAGKLSSSGIVNVYGNDTTRGFFNYGAWAEGNGSLISFTGGNVNLLGDNTVGVYAGDLGKIALSGDSTVNFSNGINQIGYYIYGAGSSITNTSTGQQDVSTAGSTLMRIAGGATLSGVGGATMAASGEGSAIIVGSDAGTHVSAGGMTLNVNGINASGVKIEGGAVGNIDNTTSINLSGQGAIAGIADGQGHKLDGSNNGAINNATALTAAANLSSSLNGVTGYIARNQAKLTNSGNITFTGDNATGIRVDEGAVGSNSGNIILDGSGSVGLTANANTEQTTLGSTGNITLNGSWNGSDDLTRTTGILADGDKVVVTMGDGTRAASVNMNGAGSVGVYASGGSTVMLKDKVAVNFDTDQSDQVAFWVNGAGSNIITQAGSTLTQVIGDGATLFNVTGGAEFSGDLNLELFGKAGSNKITSGIRVSGAGSEATLGGNSQVTVGTNATGVLAESGGKAVIEQNVTFNVTGSNAVVGKSTGNGAKVENHASVISGAGSSGSIAFLAQHGGSIDNQGEINLSSGSGHTAIDVDNGHVTNTGNISASGTAIHITGAGSTINNSGVITAVDGKAAIHVDTGAELDLSAVSGSGTIVAKGSADGILLDTGAVSLNVANTVIDMSDVTSSGIGIHNVAGIGGIKLDNTHIKVGGTGIGIKTGASLAKSNSGIIDVTDGTGILYRNEDGSAVASNLDFSDSSALTINVAGSGIGVLATLDGHNRSVNTGASVNIRNTAGGSAIDVTGAKSVTNSGHLVSQSTVADGNVLNVHDANTINNSGTIAASSADISAIAMSYVGDKTFTNTGDITGFLDFSAGNNLINLVGGTLTGSVKASGGKNTLTAFGDSVQTGAIELAGNQTQVVNVRDSATIGDVILSGHAAHQVTLTTGAVAGDMTLGNGNNLLSISDGQVDNVVMGNGNNSLLSASGTLADITLGNGDNHLTLSGTSTAGTTTLGQGENSLSLSDSATLSGTLSTAGGKTQLTLADTARINSFIGAHGSENTVVVKDSATFSSLDVGTGGANDSLTFDGADYRLLNTADIQHFDLLNLTQGSNFTTAQRIQMGDTSSSTGKITIDGSSSLIFNPLSAYILNHALSGTGLVDIQSGTSFDFGASAGNQFAGLVQMNSTDFALSGFNTTALSKSILSVMGNNTTTVGGGSQSIGGLVFNGGTVDFGVSLPNASGAGNRIQAAMLNASGTGNVQINYSGFDNGVIPQVNQTLGLLDQQTHTLIQLVGAATVSGEAGNLTLVDGQGDAITDATTTLIKQGANNAANAHYDYRLTTYDNNGNANGLYVSYGLTQLDLLGSGVSQLVINTANSGQKALSAKVTGSGDLGIIAGNGINALTLSNLTNSYIGATDLQSGTLIVGTDNALGQTSALKLASGTTTDLNGKTQTIGALNGAVGSTFNLNGGSLTLNNGGVSLGDLTGRGQLTVASGILTMAHANIGLTVDTMLTVNAGAETLLQDINALGSSLIVANGSLTLDHINGTFANQVSGNGQLSSHSGSDIHLSANNSGFSGVMDIDSTSVLTVNSTNNLGSTTQVQNANRFMVDNAGAMTLEAVVSGSGELLKTNAGTLTISGANTYSGKTDIQRGIVAISSDANLGNGSATNQTVLNGGDLQITADLSSGRDIVLAQSGRVMVDSGKTATMSGWDDLNNSASAFTKAGEGTLIWNGDNHANTAQVNVASGTLQVSHLNQLASAIGVVNLEAVGRLSLLQTIASDTDFTRQLTGSGELWVNLADKDREFSLNASTVGGDFTGLVTLNSGRFRFNTDADNTLKLATLRLNAQGSTKLNGAHVIGGLTMNGGQLEVDYSPIDFRSEGTLTVNSLDVTGGGNLAISTPGNLPNLLPATGSSLFDQDDNSGDHIVIASTVNGAGSQLAVTKHDGTPVASDTVIELTQDTTPGSTAVGNAHYNYFGAVKSDGLYLGYGLTQLDAFAGQSIILDNSNATDNALGAKLTGDGGFTVNANNTVRIGNAASDYTGVTRINSGKVELITNNALGQTSQLAMLSGTVMDVSGNSQTVGSLATQSGSLIDLNHGSLNITRGGQADGELTGFGQLTLSGGALTLTQNNSLLMAGIDIQSGATAQLSKPQGLGQGLITNNGLLHLDSAKGTLLNSLKGNGETQLTNGAEMTLGGDGSGYTGTFSTTAGTTLIVTNGSQLGAGVINNAGTFVADTEGRWTLANSLSGSGTLVKRGSGTLVVDGDNLSAGLTDIENGLLLLGETPASSMLGRAASASANLLGDVIIRESGALGGYGTVTGNVTNGGTLMMGNAATGNGDDIFTIDGNYHGDKGIVVFNTQLADDSSSTDRLVISGNSTGQSSVVVTSARGEGALTSDGIKLIDVQGSSVGQFALSGRAIAGAYEYFLYQGAISTPDDGDWYLRSALNSDNPDPSIYRPEAGGYLANMAAAGNLFSQRLADREGRAENSSMWLRQTGSRNKHRDSSGQLHTATNSYVVQGGGEVFGTQFTDTDQFGLGIMMAYGQADSKVHSQKTGYKVNSSIDGYSFGVYGTWYQDAKTLNGAYVDSWVQYSWLDAEVNGQEVAKESYDMDGFSASVEAGYRLPVYLGVNGDVFVTPQAQITWNGIKADDHMETNGSRVSSSGNDNVQTRLGVKVSRDGVSDKDKGTDKLFTTYAEVNWLYNSQQYGAVMDGVEVKQGGGSHLGELKLGAEGQLNQHVNLWANVGQQLGNEGYSDTSVNLGVKYRF